MCDRSMGIEKSDLFPPSLRRIFVVTFRTFEEVFRVVVLSRCQRVAIIHVRD